MSKNEKQFQSYFMKIAKPLNFYRTSLVSNDGYPDVTAFRGDRHSLVELKDLELGKRGDKKLKQCFELTQPPWYLRYFKQGGNRLFVAWRVHDHEGNKWYGLWRLNEPMVKKLAANELYYSELKTNGNYKEFKYCKDLIKEIVV